MQRKQNDRRQSFEKLALPHLDALYGMALRLTQDEKDAEDLVQDSLVKAYRFFHRFEEGSNIKAWLFKVLVNLFYNTCRKNRNIHRLHVDAEMDPHYERFVSEASVSGQNAESIILDQIAVEEVSQAVQELPEEFRLAVLLCDLHELSYKEIAEVLNCPVGTVMSRLYRGRRLLQKKLADYAVEQGYISPEKAETALGGKAAAAAGGEAGSKMADLQAYRSKKGKR